MLKKLNTLKLDEEERDCRYGVISLAKEKVVLMTFDCVEFFSLLHY